MQVKIQKFPTSRDLYIVPIGNEISRLLFSHIVHENRIRDTELNREFLNQMAILHGHRLFIQEEIK